MRGVLHRAFLLGLGALFAPTLGIADSTSLPHIAVLSVKAPEDQMQAFEEGLREHGWVQGSTVDLVHHTLGGRGDALVATGANAISQAPDIIVAVGTTPARVAKAATTDIPIVAVTGDMVSAGLVENVSQPEANITGFSFFNTELPTKRAELLLQVNPELRRLTILIYARSTPAQAPALALLEEFLTAKGITAEVVRVAEVDDIETVIAGIPSSSEESILVWPSPVFDGSARRIGGMVAKHNVISMLPWKAYVEGGGLMSYSPDIVAIWGEASTYVDRILRGARPGDLPVTLPTSFELVINLRSARALGILIPYSMLLRADRIIE